MCVVHGEGVVDGGDGRHELQRTLHIQSLPQLHPCVLLTRTRTTCLVHNYVEL